MIKKKYIHNFHNSHLTVFYGKSKQLALKNSKTC